MPSTSTVREAAKRCHINQHDKPTTMPNGNETIGVNSLENMQQSSIMIIRQCNNKKA